MTVNSCVGIALFIFIQTIIAELTNTDVTIATHPDNIENIQQDLCASDAWSLYDETVVYCATAAQVTAASAVRYTATGDLYKCKWWTQGNMPYPIDPNGPWGLQKQCIAWTESFVQGSITPFTVVNVLKDAELVIDIEPYLGFRIGAIYVVVNNMYSTLASKFSNYQLIYTTASPDSSAQLRITFDNIQTPAYKIEIRFTPFVATTAAPSQSPIESPTQSPIKSPTTSPVESPTASPIESPSTSPTKSPSSNPSVSPSQNPSMSPSLYPSVSPSRNPSLSPSTSPSLYPSVSPSSSPSASPSRYSDTARPSQNPSQNPSLSPSVYPSTSPSLNPSVSPSQNPTTYSPSYHTWSPTLPPLQENNEDDQGDDDQGDDDQGEDEDGDGSMRGSAGNNSPAGMEEDVATKSTQSVIVFAVLGIIPLFFICMAVCCFVRNCKKEESETSDADTDIYVVSDDDSPSPRLGDVTPKGGVTPNGDETPRNAAGDNDVDKMMVIQRKFKNAPDVKESDIHMAIDIMFRD